MKIFSKKPFALLSAGVLCCTMLCACNAGVTTSTNASSSAVGAQNSAGSPEASAAHAEIQAIVDDYIVPRWEIMDDHMGETPLPADNNYEYIADTGNKGLWIGTKGSFHDDQEDKVWYFYDENFKVYFIYRHIDSNEFRYYIHDDKVIKYTVGALKNEQASYYRGDSNFDASSDNIVHQANVALQTVENVTGKLW